MTSISKGPLKSVVEVPGSKSYANRALILAAIKEEAFTLYHLPEATDVTFLLRCLKQLGVKLHVQDGACTVLNSFPACEQGNVRLEVGEGGTTARFLAALVLRGKFVYELVLGERLKNRPWQEFIDLVNQYGGKARLEDRVLTLQGPLQLPAEIKVDCARTTQFASGLLLAFADTESKVTPTNLNSSQSYWEMTEKLTSVISSGSSYTIPLDWSSASYPLAYGALNHPVLMKALFLDRYQADSKFAEILKALDALKETSEGVEVYPLRKPRAMQVDVSDCLDLVPALSFLLAHVPGRHELSGIDNLIHKESDRLTEVQSLLSKFERSTEVVQHKLYIEGRQRQINRQVELKLPDDHRMVMTGALFLRHHAGGVLSPVKAVEKSYPQFFDLFRI